MAILLEPAVTVLNMLLYVTGLPPTVPATETSMGGVSVDISPNEYAPFESVVVVNVLPFTSVRITFALVIAAPTDAVPDKPVVMRLAVPPPPPPHPIKIPDTTKGMMGNNFEIFIFHLY